MEILLQSIPAPNEVLRADLLGGRRSDVSLKQGADPLVLGKNAATGIADSSMKRKMISVQAHLDKFVRLEVLVELPKISVNGRIVPSAHTNLRSNDVISLHGDSCSYSYKVIVKKPHQQQQHAAPHIGSPSSSSAATKMKSSKKRKSHPTSTAMVDMTEEFSCPVCLDLFVEPTLLVPCGHTACRNCLDQISTECMTCRMPFHATAPNWTVDHALAKLVENDTGHSFFGDDDMASYKTRRADAAE